MSTQHKDILAEICGRKRAHVSERKTQVSESKLIGQLTDVTPPRGFIKFLLRDVAKGHYGFICEIKKASPSKGLIRPGNFNPAELAQAYERGGASCLSVLTDEPYFQGCDAYLQEARGACSLPVLRKDFMVDPYQIIESRSLGADGVLLIMAALGDALALEMESLAVELGMDVLVEVHNSDELVRALKLSSPLVGINNRNLKTMEVSLANTLALAPKLPGHRIAVAESGLRNAEDLNACAAAGVNCFLIGETFMRQDDVAQAVMAMQRNVA